jgi:membrane protein required for beta-lactamase induction
MARKEKKMRWILILIGALILLPVAWKLLTFATGLAFGLVHLAIMLAVVIFLVGLVRRLLILR